MKTHIFITLVSSTCLMLCCKSAKPIVLLDEKLTIHDTYTIIWYGKSEAYHYQNGQYIRAKEFDYVFDVVQKRYHNTWKSVKTLHRNHPDYNGKAGARSQCMYFEIFYSATQHGLRSLLTTSLGNGEGQSDREFRKQSIIIDLAEVSNMAPYNKMKITQHYLYEEGELRETVELYKEKNGKIIPFMKNEETARFYIKN